MIKGLRDGLEVKTRVPPSQARTTRARGPIIRTQNPARGGTVQKKKPQLSML